MKPNWTWTFNNQSTVLYCTLMVNPLVCGSTCKCLTLAVIWHDIPHGQESVLSSSHAQFMECVPWLEQVQSYVAVGITVVRDHETSAPPYVKVKALEQFTWWHENPGLQLAQAAAIAADCATSMSGGYCSSWGQFTNTATATHEDDGHNALSTPTARWSLGISI